MRECCGQVDAEDTIFGGTPQCALPIVGQIMDDIGTKTVGFSNRIGFFSILYRNLYAIIVRGFRFHAKAYVNGLLFEQFIGKPPFLSLLQFTVSKGIIEIIFLSGIFFQSYQELVSFFPDMEDDAFDIFEITYWGILEAELTIVFDFDLT